MDPLVTELLAADEEVTALALVKEDMLVLLGENIQCDFDAQTMAGLGINGGDPLPYMEWMNALVDEEVAALPESDPVINSIARELLVSCHLIATHYMAYILLLNTLKVPLFPIPQLLTIIVSYIFTIYIKTPVLKPRPFWPMSVHHPFTRNRRVHKRVSPSNLGTKWRISIAYTKPLLK